jgi:hypothetical protein
MSQSDTSEIKDSSGDCEELIINVPEMTSIKGDEPDPIESKGHWGLKRVPRYESTPYIKNVKDDMCLSEGEYDANKYRAEQLKLEIEELNKHLRLERIENEEIRKKLSRDRQELMAELRHNDETSRQLHGEIVNLQNNLAKKDIKIEEGMRYIRDLKARHEADLENKDKVVQDKETEINRLGEFLDAFNGIFTEELKEKKEKREEDFNRLLRDKPTDDMKAFSSYKPYTENILDSDYGENRKTGKSNRNKVNYLSDDSDDEKCKSNKNTDKSMLYEEAMNKLDNWSLGGNMLTNEELQLLARQPELRGIKGKPTVNPAAAAFKPEIFTGKRPELAENWWKKLST